MSLPEGVLVRDVGDRVRMALHEFDSVEPTRYALAHWLTGSYRQTLVAGGGQHWPLVLRVTSGVGAVVAEAQRAVARARHAAGSLAGEFIQSLPARVHVVRIKDAAGETGFAPIDVRGASLTARALSLLVADYLMRPEAYVGDTRAA